MPSDRRNLLAKHFGGGESPQTRKPSKLPYTRLPSNEPDNSEAEDCDVDGFPNNLPPPPSFRGTAGSPAKLSGKHISAFSTPVMTSAGTGSRQASTEAFPPSPIKRNGAAMFEGSRPISGPPPPLPPRTESLFSKAAPPLPPRRPSMTCTSTTHLLSNGHETLPGGYGTMSDAQRSRVRSIQQDLDETAVIAHETIANMLERGEVLRDIEKRAVTLLVSGEVFQRTSQDHTRERRTSLRWQKSLFGCALCCVLFVILCFLFWLRRQPF